VIQDVPVIAITPSVVPGCPLTPASHVGLSKWFNHVMGQRVIRRDNFAVNHAGEPGKPTRLLPENLLETPSLGTCRRRSLNLDWLPRRTNVPFAPKIFRVETYTGITTTRQGNGAVFFVEIAIVGWDIFRTNLIS
jgi:hypothetical protein